jgi:hypothetical protein
MIDQYKLDLVLAEFLRHICQTEVGEETETRNIPQSTSEIRIKYDASRQIPRPTKLIIRKRLFRWPQSDKT